MYPDACGNLNTQSTIPHLHTNETSHSTSRTLLPISPSRCWPIRQCQVRNPRIFTNQTHTEECTGKHEEEIHMLIKLQEMDLCGRDSKLSRFSLIANQLLLSLRKKILTMFLTISPDPFLANWHKAILALQC